MLPVRSTSRGESERLLLDRLAHAPAANALHADAGRLYRAVGQTDFDRLQIWLETPSGNAGHLGTDATEVLCLTTGLNRVADLRPLSTHLTYLGHDLNPIF